MTDSTASSASSNRLAKLPRNLWIATITSFLTDISSEMILNLVPLYLANVLGAPTAVIGLIEGIAETTSSLLKTVAGYFSDRLGTRKWLAVAGYGLSSFSKPFLAIASSWPAVLAVRFADRAGKGIRTAPRDALIADSIEPSQRGIAFGLHRAGDTAGAVIGLSVALLVVLALQSQAQLLERATFNQLVLLSLIPAFAAVAVLAFGARDVPIKRSAQLNQGPRFSLRGLDPRFRRFLLIVGIFTLGNSSDAFIILRAQERGLSVAGVLGMLLTFNIVYTLVSGPAGSLSDRVGRYRLIVAGWLIYALIYLGFGLATETWHLWALFGLYGVYYGAVEGSAKALVADLVPSEQRGTAYGVYNTMIGLAALPASLLAGILWQGIGSWSGLGPSAPFIAGALLALVATVLLYRWEQNRQALTAVR